MCGESRPEEVDLLFILDLSLPGNQEICSQVEKSRNRSKHRMQCGRGASQPGVVHRFHAARKEREGGREKLFTSSQSQKRLEQGTEEVCYLL